MIIAGAGIIGLSCGWRLAQQGRRVTIFDSRETAGEASWAGAGMLAPGGEVEEASPLARMSLRSLTLYPGFVAELSDISGIAIDYQRCGAVELALNDAEAEALMQRAARQSAIGIRSEPITYTGSVIARFFPDDQLVAPRDVTSALRIACLRAGVSIRECEPVTEIMPNGLGVRTTQGEYRDNDGVLIAAGAWSSKLRTDLPVTIPVRGHLIAYHTDRPLISSILRHKHTYLLQRHGGTLIAGSSTEYVGFDRAIDQGIVSDIHSRASKLLPELAALTPAERWNGFRPGTESGNPVVGRIEGTAIWTAFGHYRNGILLAPETARIIAESVG
ncbi:MAG: FAD-dependent oxidoreductase [Bryobacteraceae bacterium]|jgi:glycine oxidase